MAELADAHGLGPCAERRAGSSPVPGTTNFAINRLRSLFYGCYSGIGSQRVAQPLYERFDRPTQASR